MRTLTCTVAVLMLIIAGSALADTRTDPLVIELTDDQVAIIVHNCPRDELTTIQLTEDQIAIIIHNFPRVEITDLTLGRVHLREDNTVELVLEGRDSVAPLARSE